MYPCSTNRNPFVDSSQQASLLRRTWGIMVGDKLNMNQQSALAVGRANCALGCITTTLYSASMVLHLECHENIWRGERVGAI